MADPTLRIKPGVWVGHRTRIDATSSAGFCWKRKVEMGHRMLAVGLVAIHVLGCSGPREQIHEEAGKPSAGAETPGTVESRVPRDGAVVFLSCALAPCRIESTVVTARGDVALIRYRNIYDVSHVAVLDLDSGSLLGPVRQARVAALSPDGRWLAWSQEDSPGIGMEALYGSTEPRSIIPSDEVSQLAFSSSGRELLVVESDVLVAYSLVSESRTVWDHLDAGERIVSASREGALLVSDVTLSRIAKPEAEREVLLEGAGELSRVVGVPGHAVVTLNVSGEPRLWMGELKSNTWGLRFTGEGFEAIDAEAGTSELRVESFVLSEVEGYWRRLELDGDGRRLVQRIRER